MDPSHDENSGGIRPATWRKHYRGGVAFLIVVVRFIEHGHHPVVVTFSRVEFWVNIPRLSPPAIDRPTVEL